MVPGAKEEWRGDADEDDETLLTEQVLLFFSFSFCVDEAPLDFKRFWNQPQERKKRQTGCEQGK